MTAGIVGAAVRLDLDDARRQPRTVTGAHEQLVEQLRRELERVAVVERSRHGPAARAARLARHRASHSRCSSSRCSRPCRAGAATGSGPPPPGVVRRRTALPGSSRPQAVGAEAGIVRRRARRAGRRARPPAARAPPTTVCASRNGVPCSTRCSARSVAAFSGSSAAAVMRVVDERRRSTISPVERQQRTARTCRARRTAAPCLPAGRGCTRAAGP